MPKSGRPQEAGSGPPPLHPQAFTCADETSDKVEMEGQVQMVSTDLKFIDKAKKIKALLDGATTEGEAAAAAEALTRLMTKHHIEEFQLNGPQASSVKHRTIDLGKGGRPNWRRGLFAAIAKANGCKTVYWTGTNKIAITGREAQIEVVEDLYIRLRTAILRLGKEGYKAYCEEITANNAIIRAHAIEDGYSAEYAAIYMEVKPDHVPVWSHSFCMAANAVLRSRLAQSREGDNAEETAIVQVMDAEVEAEYAAKHPDVKTGSRITWSHSQAGWSAGTNAASNLNIGKSVGNGRSSAGSING